MANSKINKITLQEGNHEFEQEKIAIIISAIAIVAVTAVMVCTHVCLHSWNEATCVLPMTCEKCGKTKGEPLGHEWIEATCTEAKHCVKCGLKQGEPIEHNWIDATCIVPKTCKDCKVTEGEPLGHAVKEWKIAKKSTCTAEGERTGFVIDAAKPVRKESKCSLIRKVAGK